MISQNTIANLLKKERIDYIVTPKTPFQLLRQEYERWLIGNPDQANQSKQERFKHFKSLFKDQIMLRAKLLESALNGIESGLENLLSAPFEELPDIGQTMEADIEWAMILLKDICKGLPGSDLHIITSNIRDLFTFTDDIIDGELLKESVEAIKYRLPDIVEALELYLELASEWRKLKK